MGGVPTGIPRGVEAVLLVGQRPSPWARTYILFPAAGIATYLLLLFVIPEYQEHSERPVGRWRPVSSRDVPSGRIEALAAWTGDRMVLLGGGDEMGFPSSPGGQYDPESDQWDPIDTWGPGLSGSTILDGYGVWTGEELVLWHGPSIAARYVPRGDRWLSVSPVGGPDCGGNATWIWTGEEMIVWGGAHGVLDNGMMTFVLAAEAAAYNASTDSWRRIADPPSGGWRYDHSAVWTGREVVIWGGRDAEGNYLNTGMRFDPREDVWTQMTTEGSPSPRADAHMVWTGHAVLVWGGVNDQEYFASGAVYDPSRDAWRPISTEDAPAARSGEVVVWTGRSLVVWGGATQSMVALATGALYDPVSNTWTTLETSGAPEPRRDACAVWTGSEIIIWGGSDAQGRTYYRTGGRLDELP